MGKDHSALVKDHFEIKYEDYDNLIQKLIPQYAKMHDLVVKLVDFPRQKNLSILDLGIGTGKTALELLNKFPNAILDGVDISPNMIKQAKIRLSNELERINFHEQDIKELQIKKFYDVCVGVLSIHHLNEDQKPKLFNKIFKHLNENGIFIIADIIKFDSKAETKQKEDEWKQFLINGLGKQKGQYWFENYKEEDLPSSVPNQISWLKRAGFKCVECIWQHINYAILCAKK